MVDLSRKTKKQADLSDSSMWVAALVGAGVLVAPDLNFLTAANEQTLSVGASASAMIVCFLWSAHRWFGHPRPPAFSPRLWWAVVPLTAYMVLCLTFSTAYDDEARLRLVYTCALLVSLFAYSAVADGREIRLALILYAWVEIFALFTPVAAGNPNGITFKIFGAALVLWFFSRSVFIRLVLVGAVALGAIVYEGRTAVLALAATAMTITVSRALKLPPVYRLIGLLAAVACVMAVLLQPTFLLQIVDFLPDQAASAISKGRSFGSTYADPLAGRRDFWEYSVQLISQRPLTGWGPGIQIADYNPLWAHNAFLRIGVEYGFVGGGLLLSAYVIGALTTWLGRSWEEPLAGICFASCFYMLVNGMLESIGIGSALVATNYVFFMTLFFLAKDQTPVTGPWPAQRGAIQRRFAGPRLSRRP